jgi:hypothetical protein
MLDSMIQKDQKWREVKGSNDIFLVQDKKSKG